MVDNVFGSSDLTADDFAGNVFNRGNNKGKAADKLKINAERLAFTEALDVVHDKKLSYKDRQDNLIALIGRVLPVLFEETLQKNPSNDKTSACSRMISGIKTISDILIKQRESDNKVDVDVYSEKFQAVIFALIKTFQEVLVNVGVEGSKIDEVLTSLSGELVGWEDRVSKKLKTIKGKVEVDSFIEDFKNIKI